MKKPLIILTGPTAVGKTELSLKLAKAVNGSIISADSIQVYKYMDIGSAKITQEEMAGIKHYLVDEILPDEDFNIYVFKEKACTYIDEIYSQGKVPIIVGGTGFYIQSVLYNIDFEQSNNDKEYRIYLGDLASQHGNEYLHGMLGAVDQTSADAIHPNNVKRVIRALEYYKQTGQMISEHNARQSLKKSPYNFAYYVLNDDRDILYNRINRRVDIMVENGLVREVSNLKNMGYHKNLISMQGIGYKEIYQYLDGELTLEEAVSLIKRETRHFAKRQITWFKREKEVSWINYYDYGNDKNIILNTILNNLKHKGIIG